MKVIIIKFLALTIIITSFLPKDGSANSISRRIIPVREQEVDSPVPVPPPVDIDIDPCAVRPDETSCERVNRGCGFGMSQICVRAGRTAEEYATCVAAMDAWMSCISGYCASEHGGEVDDGGVGECGPKPSN